MEIKNIESDSLTQDLPTEALPRRRLGTPLASSPRSHVKDEDIASPRSPGDAESVSTSGESRAKSIGDKKRTGSFIIRAAHSTSPRRMSVSDAASATGGWQVAAEPLPAFDPAQYSLLIVGDNCAPQRDLLRKAGHKVFVIEHARGAFGLLKTHVGAIHIALLSCSGVSDMSVDAFIEEFRATEAFASIPLLVLYDESTFTKVEECLDKGADDCLPYGLPGQILRNRVSQFLRMTWMRGLYQDEHTAKLKAERRFNDAMHMTAGREASVSDLAAVAQAFEMPSNVFSQTYGELVQRDEVDFAEFRDTVVSVVNELNQSPTQAVQLDRLRSLSMQERDWVISEYSRDKDSLKPPKLKRTDSGSKEFWEAVRQSDGILDDQPDQTTLAEARELFSQLDKNNDGQVNLSELADAIRSAGLEESETLQIMNQLDQDGSGSVDFKEFLSRFPLLDRAPLKLSELTAPSPRSASLSPMAAPTPKATASMRSLSVTSPRAPTVIDLDAPDTDSLRRSDPTPDRHSRTPSRASSMSMARMRSSRSSELLSSRVLEPPAPAPYRWPLRLRSCWLSAGHTDCT
eukprot:TRINITY_DN538_c0_g3_i1.p1 TRINITY_DN538_c0_g3~~TRINITY_DN538_c0_g3_i1.p1  ORF type:complete len:573 (-),score=198.61 TRINITY_DN538_c0_g3_i1:468-2186(-)